MESYSWGSVCVFAVTPGLFHSRLATVGKCTDVTNNLDNGSDLFKCDSEVAWKTPGPRNWIQPSLISLFTPMLFLHVKLSSVKKNTILKCWNLAFIFCTFLCFQDLGTLFVHFVSLRIFDLKIYFTHELSCTYFLEILHMKPFPITVHCLFSFAAFLLLIDPKRDMWSPELTLQISSLILPHVPGMKSLIFICFVHICIQMTSLICFCFHMFMSRKRLCETNDTSIDVTESSCYPWSLSWLEHRSMITS